MFPVLSGNCFDGAKVCDGRQDGQAAPHHREGGDEVVRAPRVRHDDQERDDDDEDERQNDVRRHRPFHERPIT